MIKIEIKDDKATVLVERPLDAAELEKLELSARLNGGKPTEEAEMALTRLAISRAISELLSARGKAVSAAQIEAKKAAQLVSRPKLVIGKK
jgi:hypothetical protein